MAQETAPGTVVIVHGAWGGGWDWKGVERELRSRGYDVYRATLTGQGERDHLASPEVGLETHVTDVANLIVWERLEEVVLVGHSYGGMVITGVAERIPERVGRLVYLDAFDGAAERARELGWPVEELIADHNPQRTMAGKVAELILGGG